MGIDKNISAPADLFSQFRIAEIDDSRIFHAYAKGLIFCDRAFPECMGRNISSVNECKSTDCFFIPSIDHSDFSRLPGYTEECRKSIDHGLHYIHKLKGASFFAELFNIFGCLDLKSPKRHLNPRCEGVGLPLHPVVRRSDSRILDAANNKAAYLGCFRVIELFQLERFPVPVPMHTFMDNGVIYSTKVTEIICFRINKNRFRVKMLCNGFSCLFIKYFDVASLKAYLTEHGKIRSDRTLFDGQPHFSCQLGNVQSHRSLQCFRIILPQKSSSRLFNLVFI